MPKNWGPEVWGRNDLPGLPGSFEPLCREIAKPLGDLLPSRPERIDPEDFFADVTD